MVGKTHSDEMAYSLNGENVHYGTPINPKAPDRIPGGIRTIDLKEVASAKLAHEHLVQHIDELRPDDALLALPTPTASRRCSRRRRSSSRRSAGGFLRAAVAGRARRAAAGDAPLGALDSCPLGLSLIAPHGRDCRLLGIASHFD